MKKTKLISIFLLILISVFATGCTKQLKEKAGLGTDGGKDSGDKVENVKGDLMDVIKLGKPVKCTGSVDSEEGTMNMTVYASGKKSYSEMEVNSEDGEFKMYTVYDGDWMYMWSDMKGSPEAESMNIATKMKVSDLEDMAKDMPTAGDYDSEGSEEVQAFRKELNYKCRVWVPNPAKFTPPSDIEFMDMTQMMESFADPENMENMMESGCEMCDLIQDASQRAECKAEMGCN